MAHLSYAFACPRRVPSVLSLLSQLPLPTPSKSKVLWASRWPRHNHSWCTEQKLVGERGHGTLQRGQNIISQISKQSWEAPSIYLTKQTYQEGASWKEPRDGKELSCRGDMYQLPMASVTIAYCKRGLILFEEGKQLVGV